MERTYNEFVDNGLYVLAYYLDKKIEDIDLSDIIGSKEEFSEQILDLLLLEDSYFKKVAYHSHMNSPFTQIFVSKSLTREKQLEMIKERFNYLLDNIGSDKHCLLCGKKQVNVHLEINRTYMPGLVSDTFYNSANNLRTVDICPVCAYLSMLSLLNIQLINNTPVLYVSDSHRFMKRYTENMQSKVTMRSLMNIKEKGGNNGMYFIQSITNIFSQENQLRDGHYISQIIFRNGQHVHYEKFRLDTEQMVFVRNIVNQHLINEFLNFGLLNSLLNSTYLINRLLKRDGSCELRCDPNLYREVEGFELNEKEKELIKRAARVLKENLDKTKIEQEFKRISRRKEFMDFILEYSEISPIYLNLDEYAMLEKNWFKYKQYIRAALCLLYHEDKKKEEILEG